MKFAALFSFEKSLMRLGVSCGNVAMSEHSEGFQKPDTVFCSLQVDVFELKAIDEVGLYIEV